MATGYTADIIEGDGIDFKTFAMNCARAFGACVELRDEPAGGDKIPAELTVDPYYQARVDEAVAALEAAGEYTMAEWDAERARVEALRSQSAAEARAHAEKVHERCTSMLKCVEAWEPPTLDHVGLKSFMLKQLHSTIEFDGVSYTPEVVSVPLPEFIVSEHARLTQNVAWAKKSLAQAVESVARRNAWIKALRGSLE